MALTVPLPRAPLDARHARSGTRHELGWADRRRATSGRQLLTGLRFDVLELPAEAGFATAAAASAAPGRVPVGPATRPTGCGCWWPRAAPTSCRGCWTGWSGAESPWI